MQHKFWALVFCVLLLGVFVPRARADEGNKEVKFTIRGPIEVPGRVLDPGRYDLKLTSNDGPIAALWRVNGTKFIGYYMTTPVDRAPQNDKVEVKLVETRKGNPERLSEWFFPGDTRGNEFVYPTSARPVVASENCGCTTQMAQR